MAISISTDRTDSSGKELLTYGTAAFPAALFDDDLSKIRVTWHWHDELELVVIVKGEVILLADGKELLLKEGEGYFANSGVLHSEKIITKDALQHAIVFSPRIVASKEDLIWSSYVQPVLSSHSLSYLTLRPSLPWQKEILESAENAWKCGAYETEDYPIVVREELTGIMRLIRGHMEPSMFEHAGIAGRERDELRIKKTIRFIEDHWRDQIAIDEIAASASISVSTLLRLYHDILHTTPIRYLIELRLDRIAETLKDNPDLKIKEAVYAGGFSDISYFNRCFIKRFHMTPTEYRRLK